MKERPEHFLLLLKVPKCFFLHSFLRSPAVHIILGDVTVIECHFCKIETYC